MTSILKTRSPLITFSRSIIKRYNWENEGIQYPGFKYYPRHPDQKDDPCEPTKLFRVQRIKPFKGNPYWEKDILKAIGLDGKPSDVAIVKNIPEMCAKLWKIKHLVKIEPITFPDGFPTENDLNATKLKENGQLRIMKELKPSNEVLEATDKFENDEKKVDTVTLRISLRKKWLSGWDTSL